MALTAAAAKNATPKEKDFKLADEKGLFLLIRTSGAKYWRMKYRYAGKEKLLAIGVFPEVTLAQARLKRDDARRLLQNKIDPMASRQAAKHAQTEAAANSFELLAHEWLIKRGKKSEGGDKRLMRLLEKDLFPSLGHLPVSEITPPVLLDTLRKIEARGAIETAHRAKQTASQVFRYGVATFRCERDPSADLSGALKTPTSTHFSSITDPKAFGSLLLSIDNYQATPTVSNALKLAPLVFLRPGELRQLEWSEINWNESRIEIPATKMKMDQPHIVPLSKQAEKVLRDQEEQVRVGQFVFSSARGLSRPLSDNGMRTALRSMGYSNEVITPHGFRATARTLLDEVLGFKIEWIEQQLAHAVKDVNGRAYNRTKHLKQRVEMMQKWADYLDELKIQASSKNVISTNFKRDLA